MGDIYDDLVQATNADPEAVPFEINVFEGLRSLKMRDRQFPWSITTPEYEYLRDFVASRGLKRGYELATGFGISASAIGQGMLKTGGKLVTMDAYVEEKHTAEGPLGYTHEGEADSQALGLKSTKWLIKHFGLENTVYPTVGWSPEDTEKNIASVIGDDKLDFVFIDGQHSEEAIHKDFLSIVKRLADKYIILFHDADVVINQYFRLHEMIEAVLQQPMLFVDGLRRPHGWDMAYIGTIR